MIDTDKYEGHTEGPWEADLDDEGKRWVDAYDDEGNINLCRITNGTRVDAQLIADAPLLLAEVKRLREGILEFADYLEDKVTPYMTNDMHEVVPIGGMVSDLHEMIKGVE